ncbi:hypothetical protein ACTHS1_12750, partial [Neisseria sp. P0014.S008]|uniref:hypothetical protein n=1 Tax=Neisseria sp. P0014.S008 TaxID=3436754 RepID=UPI003F8042E5
GGNSILALTGGRCVEFGVYFLNVLAFGFYGFNKFFVFGTGRYLVWGGGVLFFPLGFFAGVVFLGTGGKVGFVVAAVT